MPTPTPGQLLWLGLAGAATVGLGLRFSSPTPRRGEAFLRECGVLAPTPTQSERAAAYLRQHRQIFLVLVILLVPGLTGLAALVGEGEASLTWGLVGGLVGGLLLTLVVAEVTRITARPRDAGHRRRPGDGRRSLDPFHLGAVAIALALFASCLLATAVGFVAQHWANDVVAWHSERVELLGSGAFTTPPQGSARLWLVLVLLLAVAAATTVAVWLGLSGERDSDDASLDAALRMRTIRVALGTGALASALLTLAALRRLTVIVLPRLDVWAERVLPPALAWDFPDLPGWLPPAYHVLDSFLTPLLTGCALCVAVLVHPALWWRGERSG
jgi:hypothetical protein